MKNFYIVIFTLLIFIGFVRAQDITQLLDIPTARVTEYGEYDLRFRFYSKGGILNSLSFGVLNRVNIGFSWDLEEVVGTENIDVNEPTLHLKFRFYDGTFQFPALAFGYDGQGYFFDKDEDEYTQREKGVYLVASQELFIPKLELTLGGNIFDFSEDEFYGFTGMQYTLHPVMIIAELDNIHHIEFNRINGGLRILVTSLITVDLAARDIGAKGRNAERIIQINYRGTF